MATKPQKKPKKPSAKSYSAKSLGLHKHTLPHSIVDVVGALQRAGFEAYIVGGGVRDSLLGLAPKDFDAVTNARPHEIKAIFGGRCRIIGRRFQLAHVYSGREMIEVATFRAPPKDDTHTTEDGMLTRDNVWGTIEQDFARRDFSINALYYNPIKGEVLDFCTAINDIKTKTLRLLGDAKVRIEEDPVRLLRALRFKAKLGFDFDKALASQFCDENWSLLEQVSTHRLYDETHKMFCGGYLAPLLPLLFEYGAMTSLMTYPPKAPNPLITKVASNTDWRVNQDQGVNPAFFYATLLWENYLYALAKFKKKGLPFYEAQAKAAALVVEAQRNKTAIPRFAEEFISDIWHLQPKLVNPRVREIEMLFRHNKFRAALDFLMVREGFDECSLSEPTHHMGAWWQSYQAADVKNRSLMVQEFGAKSGRTRRQTKDNAELIQLQQLSMRQSQESLPPPKPLFVIEKKPVPKKRTTVVPVFDKVVYSDDDFLRLLNNDEPYIPSVRYRKRQPSSSLSILEREQAMSEPKSVKTKTKTTNIAQKPAKAVANGEIKPKAKKTRKKSNAKPKADE